MVVVLMPAAAVLMIVLMMMLMGVMLVSRVRVDMTATAAFRSMLMTTAFVVLMIGIFLGMAFLMVVAAGRFDLQGDEIEEGEHAHSETRGEGEKLEFRGHLLLDAAAGVEINEEHPPDEEGGDGAVGCETAAQGSGIHGVGGGGSKDEMHPKVTQDPGDNKEAQRENDDEFFPEHGEIHEDKLHIQHRPEDQEGQLGGRLDREIGRHKGI